MKRHLPLIMFTLLVVVFRIVGSMFPESFPNFQPLGALFFCCAIMVKDSRAWIAPMIAWVVSYPAPALIEGNASYLGFETMIFTGLALAAVFFCGRKLMDSGMSATLAGSVVAALIFHLITNGAAWLLSPIYAKNFLGLIQSVWTGPEFSPVPSWVFLRNMAASNLIFTAIFLSARSALPSISHASARPEAR